MSRNPAEWNKASRVGNAGLHLYVPKEEVEKALASAGIPIDARSLVVKSTWLKTSSRGTGRLVVQLRLEAAKGD
jgi:hypothetical protein